MTINSTRRGVLAGMATAPLLTLPAAASQDAEFLALHERYLAAKAKALVAQDAYDAIEAAWFTNRPPSPKVECTLYGGFVYHTFYTEAEIEAIRGAPAYDRDIAQFRRTKAEYKATRDACGLTQAEDIKEALGIREWDWFEELARHPVFTAEGVRIKLELLSWALPIGEMGENIILADTALEGAGRLVDGGAS